MPGISLAVRKKWLSVAIAAGVFTLLSVPVALLLRLPLEQAVVGAGLAGFLLGTFEEFYVQGAIGRPLRAMHPVKSLLLYSLVLLALFIGVIHLNHALFGRLDALPYVYDRLPVLLPVMFVLGIFAVMALRVIGFLGARNVAVLLLGKYHRPVVEQKLLLFLDIRGSTSLVEELGPLRTRALIGKFFFDISRPITNNGGDIYRFTGDGLVATWDWRPGRQDSRIVDAVDAIGQVIRAEADVYRAAFGHVPAFRIGAHAGEVVTSEEGDTKRAIGFYGDTIHIAARMEQKAKELGVQCLMSDVVAECMADRRDRLHLLRKEPLRGISRRIGMYELLTRDGREEE